MKQKFEKLDKLLMEARYTSAFCDGDEGVIDMLDYWLDQWLQYKDHCPVCGVQNICP